MLVVVLLHSIELIAPTRLHCIDHWPEYHCGHDRLAMSCWRYNHLCYPPLGHQASFHLSFQDRNLLSVDTRYPYRIDLSCTVPSAQATALIALLCPLATPLNTPSTKLLRPKVPWKESGLLDNKYFQKRQDDYPTSGGCIHGPSSRGCWHGEFDINTDMDKSWPNTGKVVKVVQPSISLN
jgi:hypothetical protein